MNFWKKCPLLLILLASGLIISAVSRANLDGSYRDFEKKTVMTPVLAAFFQGIKEEKYPWSGTEIEDIQELAQKDEEEARREEENIPEETGKFQEAEEEKEEAAEAWNEEEAKDQNGVAGLADGGLEEQEEADGGDEPEAKEHLQEEPEAKEHVQGEPETKEHVQGAPGTKEHAQKEPEPQGQEEPGGPAEAEQPEETGQEAGSAQTEGTEPESTAHTWQLGRVEEDYFEDALFIGDSRTQGLYEYGGFSENVTFYCKTSLTVYDLFKKEKAFIKEDGKSLTLEQALTQHQFSKIYLMIGINEMGTGTAESFFEEYARAVFKIRQLQPEAVIFVQAIMRVGAQKNASDPIFNNTNIAIRNVEIATLADGQSIFYIDANEVLCDENGNLFDGWSNDQIHLKAKYYAVWKEFLMDHGVVEAS